MMHLLTPCARPIPGPTDGPSHTATNRNPRPRTRSGLTLTRWAWLLLSAACTQAACEHRVQVHTFDIEIQAESDPGKPVALVAVRNGGQELGKTNADGQLQLSLQGRAGDQLALEVTCPSGYASPQQPMRVILRPLASERVPTYQTACRPLVRSLVIAVKAENGPDIPVIYQGREVARTDDQGAAHALLQVPPEQQITLVLDTSAPQHQNLRPRSPELTFTMPERDEVAVFEETFAVEKPKVRRPVKSKPKLPVPIR